MIWNRRTTYSKKYWLRWCKMAFLMIQRSSFLLEISSRNLLRWIIEDLGESVFSRSGAAFWLKFQLKEMKPMLSTSRATIKPLAFACNRYLQLQIIYSNAHWFSRLTSSSSSGVKSFLMLNCFLISSGVLPLIIFATVQQVRSSRFLMFR